MIEGVFGQAYKPEKYRQQTDDYLKIITSKLDDITI
jgi:hypothetical protein